MSMRWASLLTGSQACRAAGRQGVTELGRTGTTELGRTGMTELGRACDAVRAGLGVRQDLSPALIAEAQAVVAVPASPVRDVTSLLLLTIGRSGARTSTSPCSSSVPAVATGCPTRLPTSPPSWLLAATGAVWLSRVAFQGGFPGRAGVRA